MKKVRCVNTVRGFWKDLFSQRFEGFTFENCDNDTTDVLVDNNKGLTRLIRSIVCLRIFDYFGVYRVLKVNDNDIDIILSYNRLLKSKKPYILVLENPLAPVHYCVNRPKHFISRIRLKRSFSDENLKAIVCLNKATLNTLKRYYYIPEKLKLQLIYPMICSDISSEEINQRRMENKKECIECLFVSSQFNLKGGCELVESIKRNKWDEREDVRFTIITNLKEIDDGSLFELKKMKNVKVFDYNFSRKDLYDIYLKTDILINLTRMDSASLVTMEAVKFGCAVISTKMYAIKEMVIDGYNGYLTEPTCKVWLDDDMKNDISVKERNHLDEAFIDERIVQYESEKLNYLLANKHIIKQFQENSLKLYETEFSEDKIRSEWESIIRGTE